MKHLGWAGSLTLVVGGWLLAAPAAARAAEPCYMAFVHGSGSNFHDEDEPSSPAIAGYWSPGGGDAMSFVYQSSRGWADDACIVWKVGYDGDQQWWSVRAAGKVAASLHDFIDQYDIPDGKLILVGHSMGAVVARYLVNSGVPEAPFYNEYTWMDPRMDYDLVRRKTAYIISLQGPHTGSQAADSLYGDADHAISNGGGDIARVFNIKDPTNATSVMTRAYMEAAGGPGGEMGDEGRQVMMYTVAGRSTDDESGNGMDDDDHLSLAWVMLCYKRGAANSWGAACQWDVWNFKTIPGDGLVEGASGHGQWLRPGSNGKGPNGSATISGALSPWLDITHNHNHGRWDDLIAPISDFRSKTATSYYIGGYVGDHRGSLP